TVWPFGRWESTRSNRWPGPTPAADGRAKVGSSPAAGTRCHSPSGSTVPSPAARRSLARALGTLFARLHDAGVIHPDPHPGNLLIESASDGGLRFVVIDLHAVAP